MIRRGTFVFPADDRDFLQLLEVRANNGSVKTVETMYVLAGRSYYVPETVVSCDDPGLYRGADRTTVKPREKRLARRVADVAENVLQPQMVCWVHTHPNGSTNPSDGDKKWCTHTKSRFDKHFEGDYEFFLGIHGVGERGEPDWEWMRRPERTDENEVSWWGEYRKHKLAVYDEAFDPRPVTVTSVAELQQQPQRQAGGGIQARPEPETGGEIWD